MNKKTKSGERRCANKACNCRLSMYNHGDFCALCQRKDNNARLLEGKEPKQWKDQQRETALEKVE